MEGGKKNTKAPKVVKRGTGPVVKGRPHEGKKSSKGKRGGVTGDQEPTTFKGNEVYDGTITKDRNVPSSQKLNKTPEW